MSSKSSKKNEQKKIIKKKLVWEFCVKDFPKLRPKRSIYNESFYAVKNMQEYIKIYTNNFSIQTN